ncbi:MAG: SDR family oxidoreductase [Anaerolineae bacterium]
MAEAQSTTAHHQTALITGASSGIGAAYAQQLAAQGYNLILTARREDRLLELAAELQTRHAINVRIVAADLAAEDGIQAVERVIRETPHLTMLINNAGFGNHGQFTEIELHKILDMITVHITASVRLIHAALPGMLARNTGSIINVSSVAAFSHGGGSPGYSASKAYLNVFSINLQAELKRTGIRVQALCPGFTITEFHDREIAGGHFRRADYPDWMWMHADDVVAESLAALKTKKVIVIPGAQYKLLVRLAGTGIIPMARRVLRLVRRR